MEQRPDAILIFGEGLQSLSDEQYLNLISFLGNTGLETVPVRSQIVEQVIGSRNILPVSESFPPGTLANMSTLHSFAEHTDFSTRHATRVYKALLQLPTMYQRIAHAQDTKILPEAEAAPLLERGSAQVHFIDSHSAGLTSIEDAQILLDVRSLRPGILDQTLGDESDLHEKSLSFLTAFYAHQLGEQAK